MNWVALAACGAFVSMLVNLGVFFRMAFHAGEVNQKVNDHERRIGVLEAARRMLA